MKDSGPRYLIVGGGRWAGVVGEVLGTSRRTVSYLRETRRGNHETADQFKARLIESIGATGAAVAWVCVPPCSDLPLIVESAVRAGLHVVVEKPWLCSRAATEVIAELARLRRVLVGIHFQYCFLDAVEDLRRRAVTLGELSFRGTFTLSRPDRLGIPALENLGSHLLAIREYAVPESRILEMRCAYDAADERWVRVESGAGKDELIQLMTNEPIIQRFVLRFEEAMDSLDFPLNLEFASRVFDVLSGRAS